MLFHVISYLESVNLELPRRSKGRSVYGPRSQIPCFINYKMCQMLKFVHRTNPSDANAIQSPNAPYPCYSIGNLIDKILPPPICITAYITNHI